MTPRTRPPFDAGLTRRETAAGLAYLPLHFVVWPLLSDAAAARWSELPVGTANLVYYALGVAFLALFLLPWLRRQFETLWGNLWSCLGSLAGGYLLNMALSWAVALLIMAVGWEIPETEEVLGAAALTDADWRILKAMAIFISPLIEVSLFQGVLFGSLYPRGRGAAYLVTVLLFALAHSWPYAAVYQGGLLVVYFLQYLPAGIALCRCYERSGSAWVPVFLVMITNAMGYAMMEAAGL